MSTSTPKKTNDNEEIDLGVLFNAIGRGISQLFAFIARLIMGVLNILFALAVFVRQRIVYFFSAALLGLLVGVVIDLLLPKQYVASASVEPHFDSARQLYSNVAYLDDLAAQRDTIQLGAFFDISATEAASISTIEITPFVTETRLLQEYNNYVLGLDSLVATEITYRDYVKQADDFDRKIHTLKVTSRKPDIFGSLLGPLVASISEKEYFRDKQSTALENLELRDSITQVSIVQTDSLLSLFEEVRIVEANKEFSNGTNLYMSERAEDNTEISLLNRKITLSEQLEQIRTDKLKAKKVIDVISEFPKVGYLETGFFKNKKTQGVIGGLLLLSLFYLMLHIEGFIASRVKK